ncbi:MAG: hypothetical protein COB98_11555 [Flavobacteriaceae bacterium]|nr:MAG: hypothetical protein COB98_11555 [Flavobacteriaceae bacterium]
MKYFIIGLLLLSSQLFSQNNSFYKTLSNNGEFKFYSQINKTPVLISHGDILSENILPNYAQGLQFMQAPGLFNSTEELYSYLTNNSTFYFKSSKEKGSYYNKAGTHSNKRNMYYEGGLEAYHKSVSYNSDEEAVQDPLWQLITGVRYQLVFRESYIKDADFEFLILSTVNVFKAGIDVGSTSDIENIIKIFLKQSSEEEINKFKKNVGSYCLIKEEGVWKTCSPLAVFEYLQEKQYLHLIKEKVNSTNFYDVLSTVESGIRKYEQVH